MFCTRFMADSPPPVHTVSPHTTHQVIITTHRLDHYPPLHPPTPPTPHTHVHTPILHHSLLSVLVVDSLCQPSPHQRLSPRPQSPPSQPLRHPLRLRQLLWRTRPAPILISLATSVETPLVQHECVMFSRGLF